MSFVRRSEATVDRGQTAFDFLVGMSLFLVTVGLVLNFVPGMFEPFDTDTGPNMVTADRTAARLTEDLLVSDVDAPGSLNETCTAEFFDENGDVADCRFSHDAGDLHVSLGVSNTTGLNVTIESNGTILSANGEPTAAGPSPPPSADVVTAKRVVLLEGDQGTLFARVW